MTLHVISDLDGTLIPLKYNSTYKLLLDYFRKKKRPLRYLIAREGWLLVKLLSKLMDKRRADEIVLSFMTFGLDYEDLLSFAREWAKKVPINLDVLAEIRKYKRAKKVLLTATIEPSAKAFADMLGFEEYAATTFNIKGRKIIGVKKRHLSDTKFREVLKNHWFPYIYITDDKNEKI